MTIQRDGDVLVIDGTPDEMLLLEEYITNEREDAAANAVSWCLDMLEENGDDSARDVIELILDEL